MVLGPNFLLLNVLMASFNDFLEVLVNLLQYCHDIGQATAIYQVSTITTPIGVVEFFFYWGYGHVYISVLATYIKKRPLGRKIKNAPPMVGF